MSTSIIPSLADILGGTVSSGFEPIPPGTYNAVIVEVKVAEGKTSGIPYLNVKATIFDGEHARRWVFGMSSFSEKALTMPGGLTQLLQSTGVGASIDPSTPNNEVPALLARALVSTPVTITTKLEHDGRPGDKKFNDDGTPKMRASISGYAPPSEEFLKAFENEVSGVDDDVPF